LKSFIIEGMGTAKQDQKINPTMQWDLSALFSGMTDPKIDQLWKEINQRTDAFVEKYKGRTYHPDLTPQKLLGAIQEIESIVNEMSKPLAFASLLFSVDTSDPLRGAFLQAQREKATEINVKLLFFELELQEAPEEVIHVLAVSHVLDHYRHYIHQTRAFSSYRLTETEEIILEEMANTGGRAWVRLFEEVTSNHIYQLRRPGSDKVEDCSQEQVLTLLRHPDRALRQAAADAFTDGLLKIRRVLVFTYNNLLQEKSVEDRLREYEYPEQSRHLSNELNKETVDLVVGLCKEQQSLVERYYHVKKDILKLKELTHVDRYAPLFHTEKKIPYDEAQKIVLDSFYQFSAVMGEKAKEFFDKKWIDAAATPGKRGGAFCSYNTPDTHPVIMMSYLNELGDVKTLAHELGHGVHAALSQKQSFFNFHGTLPLAELSSTFGEMLVFERLVKESNVKDQLALYAQKIEDTFATIYRQATMFRFEQKCHEHRRTKGEIHPEQFEEYWQSEMQSMFGKSLKLGDQHSIWWSYVGHFYHTPFYVYAYAFGELLALALYEKSRQEGSSFVEQYLKVLSLGGSKRPEELMFALGVDLNSKEFWLNGFKVIESMVEHFESLWKSYSASA